MIKMSAYAKLNLSLDVTGRRDDGYHELDSIMQSISLADTVQISRADSLSVAFDVPGIDPQINTAHAAAQAFFAHTSIAAGADIRIQKRIPRMAGLGGASADAAAVLIGLSRLFGARLSAGTLAALGVKLSLYLILLLVYYLLSKIQGVKFIITFFVIYLSFTYYLLKVFIQIMKQKQTNE